LTGQGEKKKGEKKQKRPTFLRVGKGAGQGLYQQKRRKKKKIQVHCIKKKRGPLSKRRKKKRKRETVTSSVYGDFRKEKCPRGRKSLSPPALK